MPVTHTETDTNEEDHTMTGTDDQRCSA